MTHTKQPSIERKPLAGVFAGRLNAWAGIWLLAGIVGPCREPAPTPEPETPSTGAAVQGGSVPTASTSAASAPAASAAAPTARVEPTPPAQQQTPTTRHYMLTHYRESVGMRRALVTGKLEDFRSAADAVAKDEWTPRLRGEYRTHVDAIRALARSAQKAPSVGSAARELGKLGEACAACHLKFGGPGSPVAPTPLSEGADPSMVAHAAATDRLWEGLTFPSDTSWSSGMDVLMDAPKLDSDVLDVAAAAQHLRELARQGRSAGLEQRGAVFASVLTTCAGCHERLGVSVRPTPSP
ncbi:MAG: hypothetical protein ABI895_08745 [Deltaproteobacteria bacterium]